MPVFAPEKNIVEQCFGIRDRTIFDKSSTSSQDSSDGQAPLGIKKPQPHGESSPSQRRNSTSNSKTDIATEQDHRIPKPSLPAIHPNISSLSVSLSLKGLSYDRHLSTITALSASEQNQAQSRLDDEADSTMVPQTFLGFSIAGDELEPGPIFNYARVWSHLNAAKHVAEAFLESTKRQRRQQAVTPGKYWNKSPERWDYNLQGTPEEMSKYISPTNRDIEDFPVHPPPSAGLVHNCITAAFVAVFLQWGTTGAAIVIAYK